MESSLHRQLKAIYAKGSARVEVPFGKYRIDVVTDSELIEIQHGPLAAIRDKVAALLKGHRVTVVKPITSVRRLVKRTRRNSAAVSRRLSPKRGQAIEVFDDLVYFTRVFPHDRLTLDVLLVEIEEWRRPAKRRWRRRRSDFVVEDQRLESVLEVMRLRTAADLRLLVPAEVPQPFDTQQLAEACGIDRWAAQRIAYCFDKAGTTRRVGARRNARLYEWAQSDDPPPATQQVPQRGYRLTG